MIWKSVAKTRGAEVFDELEILAPVLEMAALGEKITTEAVAVGIHDNGIGRFDAGGEGEIPGALLLGGAGGYALGGGTARFHARQRAVNAVLAKFVQEARGHRGNSGWRHSNSRTVVLA